MKNYLVNLPRWSKDMLQAVFDITMLGIAYVMAHVLAHGAFIEAFEIKDLLVLIIALPVSIGLFFYVGAYRSLVRFASSKTLAQLLTVYLGATLAFWLTSFAVGRAFNWIHAVNFLLWASSSGIGVRFFVRAYLRTYKNTPKENALIYGAGELGRQLLGNIKLGHDLHAVGFIDDSEELVGRVINGVKVYSTTDLPRLISEKSIGVVLIAMQGLPLGAQKKLAALVSQKNVTLQKIPAVADILSGRTKITNFHEVKIEDLLGRKPVSAIRHLLDVNTTGKSIVVTGAGGSIGSEICRQLLRAHPRRLVLLESSEHALYQIESELSKQVSGQAVHTDIVAALVNVCDTKMLAKVMRENEAETVYHAAAYKHVPMLENNILMALSNNVLGTNSVVEAAIAMGVSSLTMISTDKAVRPTNVMGASKRFAELVCQAHAKSQSKTKISMVRFGNVLGSSGSVVPLFRSQIKKGGPVTVTHRDINRYFMTIPEASQLVIQASGMATGGEVFVLDMGKPVRILDLARSMIHLSGYQPYIRGETERGFEDTSDKIEIIISKLRPGEKLYEELLVDAVAEPTKHPGIMRAKERMLSLRELQPAINMLKTCIAIDDADMAIDLLLKLPLAYDHSGVRPKPESVARPLMRYGA